jgi:hypothetical protein
MPVLSAPPMSGGCASGNCGGWTPTYGGMPIDPSSGWTIQPAPLAAPPTTGTSEPAQVPPAGANLTPVPAPVSPQPTRITPANSHR